MPCYVYRCSAGHDHERIEPMLHLVTDEPETRRCPQCGEPARRVIARPNIEADGTHSWRDTGRNK